MRNSQNVAIVILTISAAILGALAIGGFTGRQAVGAGTTAVGGDYAAATGAYSNDLDLLYVVDIAADTLNVYVTDNNTNRVELRDKVDLGRAFR